VSRLALAITLAIAALVIAPRRTALAAPGRDRVVLADLDPELLRAVTSALAPWRLDVIVEATPPADADDAAARARASDARFIVWRHDGELIVFDRDRRSMERRPGAVGPLDAVGAATVALTVKTLMRLPPPPPPEPDETPPPPPPAGRGIEVRAQAALAARVARGSETEVGGRLIAAVLVRPWARFGWRLGAAGEIGTPAEVKRAGFKGTWSDWAVLALASWTHARAPWEIEPHLGGGVARSTLEGTETSDGRLERATLGVVRAGVAGRRRAGRWTFGASVDLDVAFGTPTYTRIGSSAQVFRVPAYAVALGLVASADFGGPGP
jgi:hypothetical protein